MAGCAVPQEEAHLPAVQATFVPAPVPAHGRFVVYAPPGASDADAELADVAARWGLHGGRGARVRVAVPGHDGPSLREAPGLAFDIGAAADVLCELHSEGPSWRSGVPGTLRVWAAVTRLAQRLLAAQRVLPDLVQDADGTVLGIWRAVTEGDDDATAARRQFARILPPAGYAVAHPGTQAGDRVWDPDGLIAAYLDAVVDEAVRTATDDPSPGRPRARILPWTARWAAALTDRTDAEVPLRDDASELVAGVAGWRASLYAPEASAVAVVRLRAPAEATGPWPMSLAVRADDGRLVEATEVWQAGDDTLQEALLAGLARCARVFPPLETLLDEQEPSSLELGVGAAWSFISEVAELLHGQVEVDLPDDVLEGELRVRLRVGAGSAEGPVVELDEDGDGAGHDLGALLEAGEETASWEVALGDEPLDADQLDELLSARAPLVHWHGRWVRVDPRVAEHVRHLGPPRRIPLAEALGLALSGSTVPDAELPLGSVDVVADGRVEMLVDRIRTASDRPPLETEPVGFSGRLRPYQCRGVAWLGGMASMGLGGVLADDMGLGKTVQLIAHLLARGGGPHLIVCPTSVVGNWERELHRFAPGLEVVRHHGPERSEEPYAGSRVVLTSYGTLRRDVEQLSATEWDVVTLDEAQFVKNPSTAGARAVRELRSRQTIAMTGTPLENRLAELWSLLDATNRGLVGSRAAFTRRYVTPIENHRDRSAAARLRRLVAPFVLRREKTDPVVAVELPDKIERTVVCPLTAEQATAYSEAVDRAMQQLSALDGMARRGRILALLTELKQICNHPERPDEEDVDVDALLGRSGKLETARSIIAEAVGSGAQVLVFSQYVRTARLLARRFGADLGVQVPVLHGGLSAGARDEVVAGFQGERGDPPPVLVVSLRAGGTGLNLTAASHVVHYDRWWNPAVEDQATDRAHRIGQTTTVEVHKLVTTGTLEERIADLLEAKRELADSVVGSGEAWITELGDQELAELVALARDTELTDFTDEAPEESRSGLVYAEAAS